MTDDIVARLRDLNPWRDLDWPEVVREAAAKIERLRAEIAYLREPDDRDDQIRFHLAEIARKDAALREAREDILLRHNARGGEFEGPDEEAVSFIDAALAPAQETSK